MSKARDLSAFVSTPADAGSSVKLKEGSDNGSNFIELKSPAALAADVTFVMPNADGTNGQALTTNGSGALAWSTVGGTPGGSDTQIQYNNAGAFAGASGLVTDGSNLTLNAQGDVRFADSDSSNWVAFQAPATIASNVTWTLPDADGTNGQVIQTNGSGTLSFATPSSTSNKIEEGDSKVEVTDTGANGTIRFFTDNVEKMKILPAGRLVLFGDSTTGGPYIGADGSGTSIITVAAGATVTLTSSDCGAVLVCVYDSQTGRGGVFFGAFTTAVTKLAGDGEATDTGSTFAVFKSVSSSTMTFKNKDSVSRPYFFGIYSALAKL